jgi:folate-dependent phosphoribosylglycinamide formyltransferase PurN
MEIHQEAVEKAHNSDEPIQVVLFGGGPVLEQGARQFICQLESHPEIAFLAAFCQSGGQTFRVAAQDLWRRRRFLALPLLLLQATSRIGRYVSRPRVEWQLHRTIGRLSDRIRYVPDIHAEKVLESVRSLKPDLGLIYGSPILKPELFEIPALGTLGIHHGKVPEYRGKKTTFWAMYHREETAGVTIQKINAGLDTGQIVKEGSVPIGRRSQRAVWNELVALGFALYLEAILEVKAGTATYRPQEGRKGKLYGDPKPGDILRFWQLQFGRWLRRG